MINTEEWLRRINSPYTDVEAPDPGEETVVLSGEEAVELALAIASYSEQLNAEYGVDSVGESHWSEKLLRRAGVDEVMEEP